MRQHRQTVAICTEYDGSRFCGWQIQPGQRTVQGILQTALRELTSDQNLQIYGCSRTDAGVHARNHISHFTAVTSVPAEKMHLAVNSSLPSDLVVRRVVPVSDQFHARFDAVAKCYSYTIWNHPVRPAIGQPYMAHVPGPLDREALKAAIPYFIGEKDFAAFKDQNGYEKSSIRRIDNIRIEENGAKLRLVIMGSGFLYHMVRILAGTLVAVAQGKLMAEDLPQIIKDKDRTKAGKTMPAAGLCLEAVYYDPPLQIQI